MFDNGSKFNYTMREGVKKKTPSAKWKTKEGKVKARVIEILKSLENVWYFMPVARGYTRAGIPDFIGCYNGRMFAIETKSIYSSHKVTALQNLELANIRDAKGIALVINEDNVDQLKELLCS